MNKKQFIFGLLILGLIGCHTTQTEKNPAETATYSDIKVVGAMKNVMWKGQLGSSINLDTLSNRNGLYGLGPISYLTGELLISNGKSYVSKVTSDTTMTVEKTFDSAAPFFVYGNVVEWNELELPASVTSIQDLEKLVDDSTTNFKRPFAFKLMGRVSSALIHIQNLPTGTKVSSPAEAHQGQTNYTIEKEDVEIIGFFSTEHKGVFTHHDTHLHMHLITKDERKMGHLDALEIEEMTLYLPRK